jgi:hypothetical protein
MVGVTNATLKRTSTDVEGFDYAIDQAMSVIKIPMCQTPGSAASIG